jgi:hypothetical protein
MEKCKWCGIRLDERYFGYAVPSKTSCDPCPPGADELHTINDMRNVNNQDETNYTYCGYYRGSPRPLPSGAPSSLPSVAPPSSHTSPPSEAPSWMLMVTSASPTVFSLCQPGQYDDPILNKCVSCLPGFYSPEPSQKKNVQRIVTHLVLR